MSDPRVFFAFWPEPDLRAAVDAARNRLFPLAGRPVPAGNLHVTAAFLGAVQPARLPGLAALAGPVPPLTITLDRLEHWPKPRVLVAASTHLTNDLWALVDDLWRRLDRLGFRRETRPYHPHVTLARDIRSVRPGLPWAPLLWPVASLALVVSEPAPEGVLYRPLAGGREADPASRHHR